MTYVLNWTLTSKQVAYCNLSDLRRFVISGDTDSVITLEDQQIVEGQMFGTGVPLDLLEKKAEETLGWLIVKVFIEKVDISL